MKTMLVLSAAGLLLAATGCEIRTGYGYDGSAYGEYPDTYYGSSIEVNPVIVPAPFDRDHYLDRRHYWDRHGYYHREGRYWHRERR